MNAIEFVKKFGLDKARYIVNDVTRFKDYRKPTYWDSDLNIYHDFKVLDESDVSIADIEQIVNSFDLVEGKGGVEVSKETLETWAFMLAVKAKVGRLAELLAEDYDALKQAIELVEKCK